MLPRARRMDASDHSILHGRDEKIQEDLQVWATTSNSPVVSERILFITNHRMKYIHTTCLLPVIPVYSFHTPPKMRRATVLNIERGDPIVVGHCSNLE
jgi:hypothetical protein